MNRMPFNVSTSASRHVSPQRHGARRRSAAERGASLLEAIAYLGIAAAVVLGAVSLLNGAFGNAKANQTSEEVLSLRTAVRKLYMGQTYPTGSLLPSLLAANAVPATLTRGAANTVSNSWGGAVTVTGNTNAFSITYAAVPQDVCVNLVSGATGWTSVAQGSGTALTTFPITAADATTLCSVTAAAGNTVTFTAS